MRARKYCNKGRKEERAKMLLKRKRLSKDQYDWEPRHQGFGTHSQSGLQQLLGRKTGSRSGDLRVSSPQWCIGIKLSYLPAPLAHKTQAVSWQGRTGKPPRVPCVWGRGRSKYGAKGREVEELLAQDLLMHVRTQKPPPPKPPRFKVYTSYRGMPLCILPEKNIE